MENNKIIAISGQPVTGKGTTVKAIIEKLKEQGYSEEDIHVISTGHEFRHYFEAIFEFIKSYGDSAELGRLSQDPNLKVFFEKREYRETLIDTIMQLKQNKIDFSSLNIENANNMQEFSGLRKVIDNIIDTGTAEMGREINSKERINEIWIIDSRLAFYNIPEAFSVRLVSNPKVAAERSFNDKSRGEIDSYNSVEEAFEAREKRKIGEQKRYLKRYGVDLEDENNYDLIIDTSYSTVEDISDTILTCLDCYTNKIPFAKTWTSPKMLLPLQSERTTLRYGESEYNFEEMAEIIKQDGYLPDSAIEVIEVDGYKYIINGHHRNFAAAYGKKTIIPYEIIAKDDEIMSQEYRGSETETARQRAKTVRSEYLYGHEWFIDEKFSYNEVYPEIYDKLKEQEEIGESR